MKMQKAFIGFALLTLCGSLAAAKCVIPVHEIESVAASIRWQGEAGDEQNAAVIRSDLRSTIARGKKSAHIVDFEAFVRPDNDEAFQVLPIPLFLVQLEKKRDTIYICSHIDTADQSKSLTVVYFLRYNQIRAITPMPLPIKQFGKLIWGPLENTPFIITKLPLSILARAQSLIVHAFSDITRIGVDRVRITATEIRLLSGGDPAQFDRNIIKSIDLTKKQNLK